MGGVLTLSFLVEATLTTLDLLSERKRPGTNNIIESFVRAFIIRCSVLITNCLNGRTAICSTFFSCKYSVALCLFVTFIETLQSTYALTCLMLAAIVEGSVEVNRRVARIFIHEHVGNC